MLTIPIQTAEQDPAQDTTTVLIIGRSEKVLIEAVDLIRQQGRHAGATNDFDNVLALFDVSSLDIVVFGGMVPPDTKERLRADLGAANPTIDFVQGLAGIPGLIAGQVQAAAVPSHRDPAAVTFNGDTRTVRITLDAPEEVRVVGFWGTAFVPPDPESTSQVLFEMPLEAGTHEVPLPGWFPTVASFVVVHIGAEVRAFEVGPMPRGATLASPQSPAQ